MSEPGRLPGGDARSRFLAELPARTQALTTLAFRFAEDRDAWAKRRELQLGLEALQGSAERVGEEVIAEHAREALACLEVCERSEQETPTHIVAELQMLVSALPWLALSDQPLPLEPESEPPSEPPPPLESTPVPRPERVHPDLALQDEEPAARPSAKVPRRERTQGQPWEQTGTRRRPLIDHDAVPESEVWAPVDPSFLESGARPLESGARPRLDHEETPPPDPFVLSSAVDEAEFELSDGPVVLTQTVSGLVAPPRPPTVLVIGRPDVVTQVRAALPRERYDVIGAFDGEEALLLLPSVEPDVVLLGQGAAEDSELIGRLRGDPDCDVSHVLLLGEQGSRGHAIELGGDDWIPEPIQPEKLCVVLDERLGLSSRGHSRLEELTEGTVDDIAAGLAEEIRRGLVQSLRAGRDERIVLDDRQELMAAAWTAIGRVRSHLAQRAGGRVQFAQASEEVGALAGPTRAQDRLELAGRRVLVADDDPAVLWFFAGLLRDAQADVVEAKNGREALQLARAQRPDLVISDILMPKLDGFALCRELKRDVMLWDVPVILLSWKEDFLLRMRELDCGAVGYLRKEAGGDQILSTVRQVLRPWLRLSTHLSTPSELHGRIEQVGVFSLLLTVARYRPDARVTIRDVFNIYEIGLRDGERVSAHRTATDGSFARGPVVLQSLLGVRGGRFSVEAAEGPLRSALVGPLSEALTEAARRLNAMLMAVSEPRILRISKVLFDNRALLSLSEASPAALTTFVRTVLKEEVPLRDRVRSGELDAQEVEAQLRELVRLGAISAVWDVKGADLIADAYEAQLLAERQPLQDPEAPTPGRLAQGAAGARSGYRGEPSSTAPDEVAWPAPPLPSEIRPVPSADLPTPVSVPGPPASAPPPVSAPALPLAEEPEPSQELPTLDSSVEDPLEIRSIAGALEPDGEEMFDQVELHVQGSDTLVDADSFGQESEVKVAVVPPAAVSARSLPPFLTNTGRRVNTLSGLGEPVFDPLDATAGFDLLDAQAPSLAPAWPAEEELEDATPTGLTWADPLSGSDAEIDAMPNVEEVLSDVGEEGVSEGGWDAVVEVVQSSERFDERSWEVSEELTNVEGAGEMSALAGAVPAPVSRETVPSPPPLPGHRVDSPAPEDLSGLRPAPSTPASTSRTLRVSGLAITPLMARVLALLAILLLGAALASVLWSGRGAAPARRGAPEERSSVETGASRLERQGAAVEEGPFPADAPTQAGTPAAPPPQAATPAAQATSDAAGEYSGGATTLPYIDRSHGVDVAEDEGLLIIRFDADGTPPAVRVGDRDLGLAPTAVALPEGRHEIVFRRSGQTRFRYLVIRRGQTRIVDVP